MAPRERKQRVGEQVCAEYHSGRLIREWRPEGTRWTLVPISSSLGSKGWLTAFLPEGFPDAVTPDFTAYITWHAVQGLTSYVRGILSSKAIFQGVGVGSSSASALGAVFNFFVRDIAGMVGGIAFAYASGSSFDANAKQWRLVADVANDVGMAIELASPLFPGYFLLCACLGSIARAITGMAGGATGAALTQHFARTGSNAADISAKDQSRERAVSIVGMVLGMGFAHLVADDLLTCWLAFSVLTVLHVYANVRAMRALVLTSLNQPRLELLVHTYLQDKDKVLLPTQVAAMETLWPPPLRALAGVLAGRAAVPIQFAAPLMNACRDWSGAKDLSVGEALAHWHARHQPESATSEYIVQLNRHGVVQVVLHAGADTGVQMRAYIHALILARQAALLGGQAAHREHLGAEARDETEMGIQAEDTARAWMLAEFKHLLTALEAAGWDTGRVFLPPVLWTATWGA